MRQNGDPMSKQNYKSTVAACCLGYVTNAAAGNLAALFFVIFRETLGLSLTQVTLLVTVSYIVQLAVDIISTKLVDRMGYRRSAITAHSLIASGFISMAALPSFLPPFAGLMIANIIYSSGAGMNELVVSPVTEACPAPDKHSLMSFIHSVYCFGTVAVILITTGALSLFGRESWRIICCMWTILPVCGIIAFSRVPLYSMTEEGGSMPLRKLLSKKIFWLFMILMFAAGAAEMAMAQWASAFAESGLGVSKAVGDLAGPCMFSLFMGISRLLRAKFDFSTDLLSLMIGCGILCTAAFLMSALASNPVLALAGCGICGLSVGILWPGVYSTAGELCPEGGTAMFAVIALAGDIGCSGGPTLVGFVSGAFGDDLQKGMLAAAVFPIILITAAIFCRSMAKKNKT